MFDFIVFNHGANTTNFYLIDGWLFIDWSMHSDGSAYLDDMYSDAYHKVC